MFDFVVSVLQFVVEWNWTLVAPLLWITAALVSSFHKPFLLHPIHLTNHSPVVSVVVMSNTPVVRTVVVAALAQVAFAIID